MAACQAGASPGKGPSVWASLEKALRPSWGLDLARGGLWEELGEGGAFSAFVHARARTCVCVCVCVVCGVGCGVGVGGQTRPPRVSRLQCPHKGCFSLLPHLQAEG